MGYPRKQPWEGDDRFMAVAAVAWPADLEIAQGWVDTSFGSDYARRQKTRGEMCSRWEGFNAASRVESELRGIETRIDRARLALEALRNTADTPSSVSDGGEGR